MSLFNDHLLLGNVWDVASALLHEKLGFKAIGTSSAAVAASLGYEDGEDMPFDALLVVVKAIASRVNLPLTVDIEGGYSRDMNEIISNINQLVELGVIGINIEDSVVENGKRHMLHEAEFARIIGTIKTEIGAGLFLNARIDAYIMGLDKPFILTCERLKAYEKAGADGVFVPCITDAVEIKQLVDLSHLPLNVMCMPDLPNFGKLQDMGVMRISMGPFAYNMMAGYFEAKLSEMVAGQSFAAILGET